MKIGIITFHRAVNYGAVLQSYALCTKIKDMLHIECDIIDYRSKFIEHYYNPWCLLLPKNWKRLVSYIIFNGNLRPSKERFFSFLKRNNCVGNSVLRTENDLIKISEKYDRIITGSDQVWSPLAAGFDSSYFLNFCIDSNKRASYAASIGISKIPESLKCDYRDRLSGFHNYSVREKSAKEIIMNLFPNENVTVDVDPTLLLTGDDWRNVISRKYIRPSLIDKSNYVLVYCISQNKELFNIAFNIASKIKCEVLYISDRWRKQKGVKNLRKVNIDEWLFLFENAQYIITDSFHGTAFSVNLGKPFFTYQNRNNKRSTRITSLLNDLQLEDRIVFNSEKVNIEKDIDYCLVHEKLGLLRIESMSNLKSIIYEK